MTHIDSQTENRSNSQSLLYLRKNGLERQNSEHRKFLRFRRRRMPRWTAKSFPKRQLSCAIRRKLTWNFI